MLAVLLVALSVGLDNFGAAAALGVTGVDHRLRLRIALVFGVFEAAMPIAGLLLGNAVASHLGSKSKLLAGSLLCLVGAYELFGALRANGGPEDGRNGLGTGRIVLLGAALSIDNLAVGFALGDYQVNILVAALVIASVSVALSLIGLEIGARLSERLGDRSEMIGGAALILIGVAIATGLL